MAMILYILYVEPLLLYLEMNLIGLKIAGISQILEAYCDDVNVLTDNLEDLVTVDTAVSEFESFSGAILSRSKKCKILGFGSWREKSVWPLDYVQTEHELKIFGIFIKDSYPSLLKRNWDYRFVKFSSCIKSWSSRFLPSLASKVEIIKSFGLSRIYYVAAILPVNATTVKKFESLIGNFIWKSSGWLLRIALDEIKNKLDDGGLNLVCVQTMCNSLLLSQLLRLLKSSYTKALLHVDSWIGDSLVDLLPAFGHCVAPKSIPDYYCHLESLVVLGRIDDLVTPSKWKSLTNKQLYAEQYKNFPLPKVQREANSTLDYSISWKRISSPILAPPDRDISYLMLHNKLPNKERLFRVGLNSDPFCHACPGSPICDLEHFFCLCSRVQSVWPRVRDLLTDMIGIDMPNDQLLNYNMKKSSYENEVVWLLGSYLSETWRILSSGSNILKEEEFFGFLKFKFKKDQSGARVSFNCIPGL